MTDLSSLGYPQGYHLGLSFVLWTIFIIIITILGVLLSLNARKSDLINVKEMFYSKSLLYICTSFQISLIQVGFFFPNQFLYFYLFGASILTISFAIYIYYWERNLTSIKRIPTISAVLSAIITVCVFITSVLAPNLIMVSLNFLGLIILLLTTLTYGLYIYLIFNFSKNIKGGEYIMVGKLWMGAMILNMIALFFDNPPGIYVLPEFIAFNIAPILLTIGMLIAFYGVSKLFIQISSYYTQTQKCAVHRGSIEKGNIVYYCPLCGIVYCENCFNLVIKREGCWNCRKGAEPDNEEEWKIEQILELNKINKLKRNNNS